MADEPNTRAFSLRLPDPLYQALRSHKDDQGRSMNQLVCDAIAQLLDQPALAPRNETISIRTHLAVDAIAPDGSAVAPLKGIARHLDNTGQTTLACILYAAAARVVAIEESTEAASRDYSRTAALADRKQLPALAVALYRAALAADPHNLEAAGRLGQALHHQAQRQEDGLDTYREAEELLRPVAPFDDRAKLFHGWSALHLARADKDPDREQRAMDEIEAALKAWAFAAHDEDDRRRWLRQVNQLAAMGRAGQTLTKDLVTFANAQARWREIDSSEIESP